MGYRFITLKLPTDYSESELQNAIRSRLGINQFTFTLDGKSLDARKKAFIH